jgi:peptide/nickel transport system substrate-binding protein
MRRNRKGGYLGWILGILMLLGIACPLFAQPGMEVLTVGWGADPTSIDPAYQSGIRDGSVLLHIMETLTTLDRQTLEVKPGLAASWEMPNESTYVFHLHKDVRFHDGTPFNAQAVKYSFERLMAPETNAPRARYYSMIKEIQVVDDYTVKMVLTGPSAFFLQVLAYYGGAIVSPTAAEEAGLKEFGSHPVGTGPFKYQEWRRGEQIVLVRNDDYWGGTPAVSEIVFKAIPDESTRVIALETGEIDMLVDVPSQDVERLQAKDDIKIITEESLRTVYVALNRKVKPFDDIRVRKALNLATDTAAIIKAMFEGQYATQPRSVISSIVVKKGFEHEYNQEKARQLLADAGFPNGFSTELWTPAGRYPKDKEVATLLAAQLGKIGVNIDVKVFEYATLSTKLRNRDYAGMVLMGWGNLTGDPNGFLEGTFYSKNTVGTLNLANYSNSEVDRLLIEGQVTIDDQKRKEIYEQVIALIHEDRPWIPLYHPKQVFALRENIEGFVPMPTEVILLDKVHK